MITTINQLQEFVGGSNQLTFKRVSPFNIPTRTKYMLPLFSLALIDQILAASGASGVQKQAYDLYMTSFCNLLMKEATPSLEVVVTDAGISRSESQNSKTAYAGQMKALVLSFEENGFNNLEELVKLLEANPTVFSEWANSPAYNSNSGILIRTASEFNSFVSLFRPSVTFQLLIDAIESIQYTKITNEIKSQNIALIFNPTTGNESLIATMGKNVKRALANLVIADHLKKASILIGSDGARIISFDYNTSKKIESTPDSVTTSFALRNYKETADLYIEEAKKIIRANPTVFTTPVDEPFTKTKAWM